MIKIDKEEKKLSSSLVSYIETVTSKSIDDLDMRYVNEFIDELNYWIDKQSEEEDQMTDTPDFLKNTNTVFYYKSSDHKYNYWSNSSGDNVVEDKYTGLCKVTIFTKKGRQ